MGIYDVIRTRQRKATGLAPTWKSILISDAQPIDDAQREAWRAILRDIRRHHGDADDVCFDGDLVDKGAHNPDPAFAASNYPYLLPDFIEDCRRIAGWSDDILFAVPGNHDYNSGTGTGASNGAPYPLVRTWRGWELAFSRRYYHTKRGNILRIHLGTMGPTSPGLILDYVVQHYFWPLVRAHQHCFIELHLHQPIAGTLGTSADETDNTMVQLGSGRFVDLMGTDGHRVDLVVSGHNSWHTAGDGLTDPGTPSQEFKHGAWHVNVGLHVPQYIPVGKPMSFCTAHYAHGSHYVRVRRWNCRTNGYVDGKDFTVVSPVPLQLSATLDFDGRNQFDERFGIVQGSYEDRPPLVVMQPQLRVPVHDGYGPPNTPQAVVMLGISDDYTDVAPGNGPAIVGYVPGATDGLQTARTGPGAMIAFEKVNGTDLDYSAHIKRYRSTAPASLAALYRDADVNAFPVNVPLRKYLAGATWLAGASAADNQWYGLAYAPERGRLVATAITGTGNRAMTSDDGGANWNIRTTPADNSWCMVIWVAALGLYVAVSIDGTERVMTSPDGVTWTLRTSPTKSWRGLCWAAGYARLVAVADAGAGQRAMTSSSATFWTARNTPADSAWKSVCWAEEFRRVIAVAASGDGNRVMISDDGGVTWVLRPSAADNDWQSVCYSPMLRRLVAVAITGTGNRVMTSDDGGDSWTIRSTPADNAWRSVCWCDQIGLYIAVASTGTGNRVMTSPDGIEWTTGISAADNPWNRVVWLPDYLQAVASGYSGTGNRVMASVSANSFPWRH